ncbi:MAG TPA: CoA transferase [Rhodopila sp.]|uniref:CaiB/BaiF CoA transferase family protein n=1 Tax=Rhodopila sp. TaxID=2480087 RepID=UPI002BB2C0E3|nr:CoA transferase [Rhodopila sp.]HVY16265.1 CoA transferase [Rhodopila sp.]
MPGPLDGIRIVDLTSMISGPQATMILADQGADVIKVENPDGGDHTRAANNRRNGFSASFLNNNRNKRSLALDLKDPAARDALLRLVATADVFIQNFRPGVIERMGLGEDAVRAVAPAIVYVSISGFGETGPYAQKPVYDPLIQAVSGLASVQAGSDTERPRLVRTILPDKLTGMTAAQAITAALLHKARTGQGQHVRLSMLDTVVAFLWGSDMGSQTFVEEHIPQQEAASFIDLIYETATSAITAAVQTNKEWLALTRALEKPEWLDDPRFKTPALRQRHINERLALIQETLMTRPAEEWLERLTREGVPCAPVLTRTQMIGHPQVAANGIVVETAHPQAGALRQARPAARFSATPATIRAGGPALGQHTAEILAGLGYTPAEISAIGASVTESAA